MVTITRAVDNLGRIVIPKEMRTQLKWEEGTKIDIIGTDSGVLLSTHKNANCLLEQAKELRRYVEAGVTADDVVQRIDELIQALEADPS